MSKKVLIIGGVAGGATTAARLRRLDENIEIIMFERSPYISYANCGLPYYIGNTIKNRADLLVQTPEAMRSRFQIDIRVENEVLSIDRENKKVMVMDLKTNTKYEESYDTLVLSPGSTPLKPPIPGISGERIFSLWNIPDTDRIKEFVTSHSVKRAVVIGGGFIGIEMVENLHDLGIHVDLVEMADQVMAPFDFEMAQIIHSHLSSQGVGLYLKNGVKEFIQNNDRTDVLLSDGTVLSADMVILSIGISPNSELAKAANLETNPRGGIIVDEHLLTSDPNIYALGDAVEVTDYVTKGKIMIPLAGPANKQGRIVANNICGKDSLYEGSQGTSVAKIFDLTAASTGYNEKQLQRAGKVYGKDYFVVTLLPKSHASYYPDAFPMTLKVIFDSTGKVLGAQNVGIDGVEKRIDVLATAMRFNADHMDLQRLELAYAPPYSSAKDPVNMAGFVAENILNHDQEVVLWREIQTLDPKTTQIIDVREIIENELGAIENSVNIPLDTLRDHFDSLDKEKELVVYCAVGIRGYIASRILKQAGFKVKNLLGGYNLYKHYSLDYTNPSCVVEDKVHKLGEDGSPEHIDMTQVHPQDLTDAIIIDACGLQCPGPIMRLNTQMSALKDQDIVKVIATDPGFVPDAQAWAKKTGNTFIKSDKENRNYVVYIKKGSKEKESSAYKEMNASTMVVFSGDLDKAIASLIIANGAAAMGKKVTMFYTFWGLNILRKNQAVSVEKNLIEKMFSMMMPRGPRKLKLSKMHMAGMGTKMIHKVMKDKNVNTLEELMKSAQEAGVRFVACTMSMDLMGIKKEELIDGVEFGGVAAYLGAAEDANHNLFI